MAGIAKLPRDLRAVRAGLTTWLIEQWPERRVLEVSEFRTSATNGYSSESLAFDVQLLSAEGQIMSEHLIARLPPFGEGIFREYDLERQFLVQQIVANAGVPVARQIGYCGDESLVGSPFLVMEFVPGRIPSNQPMYNVGGWLVETPERFQARGHLNVLKAMAQVHAVPVTEQVIETLQRRDGVGLTTELDWYYDYLLWATDGEPPREVRAVYDWCAERLPQITEPNVVSWGDARFGNVVFAGDMSVAALLDWEMATLCPPELDLGWFLGFRAQIRARTGVTTRTELPGFPEREEVINTYESLLGRKLIDIRWFEIFAMLRLAAALQSTKRLVRDLGLRDHFIFGFAPVERWVLDAMEE